MKKTLSYNNTVLCNFVFALSFTVAAGIFRAAISGKALYRDLLCILTFILFIPTDYFSYLYLNKNSEDSMSPVPLSGAATPSAGFMCKRLDALPFS